MLLIVIVIKPLNRLSKMLSALITEYTFWKELNFSGGMKVYLNGSLFKLIGGFRKV